MTRRGRSLNACRIFNPNRDADCRYTCQQQRQRQRQRQQQKNKRPNRTDIPGRLRYVCPTLERAAMRDSTSRTVRPKNTTAFSRTHTVCMLLWFLCASNCATYQPDLRDEGGSGRNGLMVSIVASSSSYMALRRSKDWRHVELKFTVLKE
jgi:hypothetical protein